MLFYMEVNNVSIVDPIVVGPFWSSAKKKRKKKSRLYFFFFLRLTSSFHFFYIFFRSKVFSFRFHVSLLVSLLEDGDGPIKEKEGPRYRSGGKQEGAKECVCVYFIQVKKKEDGGKKRKGEKGRRWSERIRECWNIPIPFRSRSRRTRWTKGGAHILRNSSLSLLRHSASSA